MNPIDVSYIFWDLISIINTMSILDIQQTTFYETMCRLVQEDQTFVLAIQGYELYHENIDSLFYKTRDFLKKHSFTHHYDMLDKAIKKIENNITEQELFEKFDNLSVSHKNDLECLMAKLTVC